MPVLEAEVKYLQSERATLLKLSKEKKWRFDPGAGDAELDVLQRQVKELSEFIVRIETTLKSAGGDKSFGLVQLLERARLLEADAAYDQAIRVYEQVLQVSPAQKQVQAHLEKLKTAWKEQSPRHAKARAFLLQTWPALEVAELGKNMEYASDALAVCKAVDDRLTPRKVLRVNAGHTANLTRELEALKRRDSEDNRNRAKALGQVGEILLQLHQETAAWLGDGKK
jgi:tetratricopeptide (TPR) repeat protein